MNASKCRKDRDFQASHRFFREIGSTEVIELSFATDSPGG